MVPGGAPRLKESMMNTTNGNGNGGTNTGIAELGETAFGQTEVGRSYLTARGHQVTVTEVIPGSHAIVQNAKGKEMRVPADQACRGPLPGDVGDAAAADQDEGPAEAPTTAKAKRAKEPRGRDPRLPEVGTQITRKWRGHEVTVTELVDGGFAVVFDDDVLGLAKSLTKAAEMVLAREGVTSGVNGYTWFRIGTPATAPRTRRATTIDALAAVVARLQARLTKAAERAAKVESELEAATKALADAKAAADAPASAAA